MATALQAAQFQTFTLYDIAPEDEQFLMLRLEEQERRELILVLNRFEELKAHVPL